MSIFLAFIYKLLGWKIEGSIPADLKKATFAVCPHNTWKDFLVGLGVRAVLKRDIGFLGKAELFQPPFGFIFKLLGGIPVIRSKNMNVVDSYAQTIVEAEDKLFSIAPEGTRKNVQKLRTGFYYISLKAGIPIIRVKFDFPKKLVTMAEPFVPSGDFEADMKTYFVPFFKNVSNTEKSWVANYENNNFDQL